MAEGVIQPHVHARRARHAVAGDAEVRQRADHRLLQPVHVFLDEVAARLQVDQRIRYHLPRPVVSHLPAAIRGHHRDVARHQHMLGLARQAEREDWRMLANP